MPAGTTQIFGTLEGPDGNVPVEVLEASPHTIAIGFPTAVVAASSAVFAHLKLRFESRELVLGRCQFLAHQVRPTRRADDPAPVGEGKVLFLDELYDFASLFRAGSAIELRRKLEQLPVLWSRKENVLPAFRDFTAELVFDLQVYRGLLDEIDRNLAQEPYSVRVNVHRVVADAEYANFHALFDQKLAGLETTVRAFSIEEHERHGFYLRKHIWDIILASDFMRRTNLKPRGYAGDSQMMRMLYENNFQGPTIFSRFVHRHPVQSTAAQAVRNRVALLADVIARCALERPGQPLRLISIASGPAWELRQIFRAPEDFARYEVTLLDQDDEALAEARTVISALEAQHKRTLKVAFIKDSVRTMMRTPDLPARWGRFSILYSMGLFDYLTAPVAKVVLRKLFELLEPGGELLVGNFHVSNPTRLYMEYWMDWVLIYRTEEQMHELARGIEGAECSVLFEETRSQMFLRMRKGG